MARAVEAQVTKMSSKGQVVIPEEIRKDMQLTEGSFFVVYCKKDSGSILLKRLELPDAVKAFEEVSKWGIEYAKEKKLDVVSQKIVTGRIDPYIINIDLPKSKLDKTRSIMSLISTLEKKGDLLTIDDVVKEATTIGIDGHTTRQIIDLLKRQGDLYELKGGYLKTVRNRATNQGK